VDLEPLCVLVDLKLPTPIFRGSLKVRSGFCPTQPPPRQPCVSRELYRDLCAATDALGANANNASATAAATIPTFEPMISSLILLPTLTSTLNRYQR
jgi:hypothetical protein